MFRSFARFFRRLFAMTLTPDTQAKIDKAFADKDAANVALTGAAGAAAALAQAQQAKSEADNANSAANQTAMNSAHDALAALAAELGFPLPG